MSMNIADGAAKAGLSLALSLSLAASPLATSALAQTPEETPKDSDVESGSVRIDENNFPDVNFRAWLSNPANIGGKGADGVLSKEDIEGITSISVRWCGIKSLSGIEHFVNLTHLNAERNELVEVDLSHFPKLKTAFLRTNNLETVKTSSANSSLVLLDVFDNRLQSIDLSGLSSLKQLIASSNDLRSLDLSANVSLVTDGFTVNNNERIAFVKLPDTKDATVRTDLLTSQESIDGYAKMIWHRGTEDGEILAEGVVKLDGSTLYSKRTANPYTVTFSLGASDATGTPSPISTEWNKEFPLPTDAGISRPGHTFAGWILPDGSLANAGKSVKNLAGRQDYAKSALVKAKWTPNSYTVEFADEKGSSTIEAAYGASFALPESAQKKEGYLFAGWTLPDGSVKKPGQTVSNLASENGAKVTLTPCWTVDELSKLKGDLAGQADSLAASKAAQNLYDSTKAVVAHLASSTKSRIENASSTQEATDAFVEFSDALAQIPTKEDIDAQALSALNGRALPSSVDDVALGNLEDASAISEEWSDPSSLFSGITNALMPAGNSLAPEEAKTVADNLARSEAAQAEVRAAKQLTEAVRFVEAKRTLLSRDLASVRSSDAAEFESALTDSAETGLSFGLLKEASSDLSEKADLARCKRSAVATIEQELSHLETFGREYSAENRALLRSLVEDGALKIESAASAQSVREEQDRASLAIRSVPDLETEKAELEESRNAALAELERALSSYDVNDYEENKWAALESAASEGRDAIRAASGKAEIERALKSALESMSSVEKKPSSGGGVSGGGSAGGSGGGDSAGDDTADGEEPGEDQDADSGTEGDGETTASPFQDVNPQAWYAESVGKAYSLGYIKGTSPESYAPENKIARADVAVIVSRMAGSDDELPEGPSPFDDVNASAYFGPAVSWAWNLGIVKGFEGSASFGPSEEITREDFAVMLWRYANAAGMDTGVANAAEALSKHPDASQASSHATEALAWAIDRGYIGQSDVLRPLDKITRAEAAAITVRMQPGGPIESLS